ncbi:MAG: tRNA pseudouridine55 synthase [Rhodothermales bacterium]|jgi:tRNA pseudouridine55 synthase
MSNRRRPEGKDPIASSGVLLVDKPAEWTSHDVVNFVRRFGFKKVGHCGTLDPAATGLLVLVLGRATRLSEKLSGQDKAYEGTLELGAVTDSQDADGKILSTADASAVTEEQIHDVFTRFADITEQLPPMVSAKKVAGKALYKYHRQGEEVERETRPVIIHELTVNSVTLPTAEFFVRCGKGFYVRTLCHDIGQDLGCGGFLRKLRRTHSGRFDIANGVDIETLRTWSKDDVIAHRIPLEDAVNMI